MMDLVKSISSFKDCYFWVSILNFRVVCIIYNNFGTLFLQKKKLWGNQIPESNPHAVFSLLHFNFSWVSILPKDVCQLVGCLLARLVAELFCVCLVLFSLIFLLKLVQKKCVSIGERFYQWCSHCFC